MVKKIRRKMKVVKKVRVPGQEAGPAEEVEEMEEDDEEVDEDEEEPGKEPEKGPAPNEDDLGLAKTVTGPTEPSDTARRMKELIDGGTSTAQMPEKPQKPVEQPKPTPPPVAPKPVPPPVAPKPVPPPVEPEPSEGDVPITDMEPLEEAEDKDAKNAKDVEDFDKHRKSMAEKSEEIDGVMKELEAELFKKEEEVRDKLEEIQKENPEGLHTILDTVKGMDKDTIKDFVTAAETLYQGQFDKLPGNGEYWTDLKKKAGIEHKAPAEEKKPAEGPQGKRDKAEEYRRREKAIDVFKKSIFTSQSGGPGKGFTSQFKMKVDGGKDQTSHFFGPLMKPGARDAKKKDESMGDFMRFGKADVAKSADKDRGEVEKALAEARLKITDTEKALADTKMDLANLRASRDERQNELETRVQELASKVSAKDDELANLKAKLEESKKSATKFLGQREMAAEIDKLQRSIENLNYEVRTKNDVILGMEQQIKDLEGELERHKEAAQKADVGVDDKARLEQLEDLKLKEEELHKLEQRTQKNLEELKEIAKDNMKAEYRLKRKEMLLENMEKNIDYQKKEIDKRTTEFERGRHDAEVKVESLDAREKDVIKKEEDFKLSKEKLDQELENLDEQRKKIKNDLMEQARMDYRLDKRQQEMRLQESKLKVLEDSMVKKELAFKAREEERRASGGLDSSQIDEVLKMKTAELARKEEALNAREMELMSKRGAGPADKEAAAFLERLRAKEEELKKLEASLKDKWAQLQLEAKKVAEGKGMVPAVPMPTTGGAEATAEIKPLLKVRCVGCRELIPIYSTVRPLKVQCPKCSKVGVLK